SRVPSPGGENLVGERKEQSASHRTVPRCSAISPIVTEPKDVEGQRKKAMELTKGRIAEWIGDPDLVCRLNLCCTLFDNYKYLFKFLA
ncbi:hypothetical protein MTR67_026422, partial [Solanum verrucosum]